MFIIYWLKLSVPMAKSMEIMSLLFLGFAIRFRALHVRFQGVNVFITFKSTKARINEILSLVLYIIPWLNSMAYIGLIGCSRHIHGYSGHAIIHIYRILYIKYVMCYLKIVCTKQSLHIQIVYLLDFGSF